MHGFKPQAHGRAQYADGGIIGNTVSAARRIMGFKPQPRPPEQPQAQPMPGGEADPAGPTPRTPERRQDGDAATRRRMAIAEQGLKDGGPVKKKFPPDDQQAETMPDNEQAEGERGPIAPGTAEVLEGPGTGTSDSIEAEMEPGTHILPEDTTDVAVSDGETGVSPEVVMSVGQAALKALTAATHNPEAARDQGEPTLDAAGMGIEGGQQQDVEDEVPHFAVGGVVGEDDEEKKRSPTAGVVPVDQRPPGVSPGLIPSGPNYGMGNVPYQPPAAAAAPAGGQMDNTLDKAVFGFYPQLSRTQQTTNLMDKALQTGVQATGPSTFAPAAPLNGPMRLDASTDPRSTLFGNPASPLAPSASAPQPAPSTVAAAPTAPAGFQPNGGRGNVNPPLAVPSTPVPGPNDVTRVGNSYSGGPNITSDGLTVNGGAPGGGFAAGNPAAGTGAPSTIGADMLPVGFKPQVFTQAPGQDWQTRQDLKNAQTGASSIVPGAAREQSTAQAEMIRGQIAQQEKNVGAQGVADAQAQGQRDVATTRAGVDVQQVGVNRQEAGTRATTAAGQQKVAEGKLSVDQGEAARRNKTADISNAGAQQIQQAQNAVATAKTPEARAQAVEVLRSLQGKYERETPNRFTVVPGGTDENGVKQASAVINNQTGEYVPQPTQQRPQAPVKGSVSVVGGKKAVFDGTKWVPQ